MRRRRGEAAGEIFRMFPTSELGAGSQDRTRRSQSDSRGWCFIQSLQRWLCIVYQLSASFRRLHIHHESFKIVSRGRDSNFDFLELSLSCKLLFYPSLASMHSTCSDPLGFDAYRNKIYCSLAIASEANTTDPVLPDPRFPSSTIYSQTFENRSSLPPKPPPPPASFDP